MTKHDFARNSIPNTDSPRSRCFLKQDPFLAGILIGIGALIIVAVALFLARAQDVSYGDETTPEGVIQNYVLALYKQDLQRAYGYLADQPGKPTYEQFVRSFLNYALTGDETLRLDTTTIEGDEAYVRIALVYRGDPFSGGWENNDVGRLVLQDGAWKISYLPYPYWQWEWYQVPALPAPEKTP